MKRTRAELRYQRERIIARRRRQFARWVGDDDRGPIDARGYVIERCKEPRPLDVRQDEYWSGRRLGMLSKWNGACTCWICASRKYRHDRAKRKREWQYETPSPFMGGGVFVVPWATSSRR